ncbi:MAG: hypothetical protein QXI12_00470 [Candidatus Methanomethyliaceae archaeon]
MKGNGYVLLVATGFAVTWAVMLMRPAQTQSPAGWPLSYQGKLLDTNMKPVEGDKTITFSLWDQPVGGTKLWEETQSKVAVRRGLFHVLLGSVKPLPQSIFREDKPLYLEVQVQGESALAPRTQLTAVPYAYRAAVASTVDNGVVTAEKLAPGLIVPQAARGDTARTVDDGAITVQKLAPGMIVPQAARADTARTVDDGAVTAEKLAPGLIVPQAARAKSADTTSVAGTLLGTVHTGWLGEPGKQATKEAVLRVEVGRTWFRLRPEFQPPGWDPDMYAIDVRFAKPFHEVSVVLSQWYNWTPRGEYTIVQNREGDLVVGFTVFMRVRPPDPEKSQDVDWIAIGW